LRGEILVEEQDRVAQKKSFVQRYKNAVTIIGSLVVLGSFVTKEIVQEHLKSTVDSLDSADQIFQIRSDSLFQEKLLTSVNVSVENVRLDEQQTPRKRAILVNTLYEAIEHDSMIIKTALERAKYSNQSVREFLRPIPNEGPLESEVDNSNKQLDTLLKANERLTGPTFVEDLLDRADFEGPLPNETAVIEETSHLRREVAEARDRALQSTDYAASLRDKALEASRRYRDEIEKRYKKYSLAIYLLFGVGWVFGLGGRLLGFDGPSGNE
jgi:hypothetical protein